MPWPVRYNFINSGGPAASALPAQPTLSLGETLSENSNIFPLATVTAATKLFADIRDLAFSRAEKSAYHFVWVDRGTNDPSLVEWRLSHPDPVFPPSWVDWKGVFILGFPIFVEIWGESLCSWMAGLLVPLDSEGMEGHFAVYLPRGQEIALLTKEELSQDDKTLRSKLLISIASAILSEEDMGVLEKDTEGAASRNLVAKRYWEGVSDLEDGETYEDLIFEEVSARQKARELIRAKNTIAPRKPPPTSAQTVNTNSATSTTVNTTLKNLYAPHIVPGIGQNTISNGVIIPKNGVQS